MLVDVYRLEDRPIIIAKFEGESTVEDGLELFRRSDELIGVDETRVYRITDAIDVSTNFGDMMRIIREASRGQPGSTTDPRIHAVFVGRHGWIKLYRDMVKLAQFGGVDMPAFTTVADALKYVELEIEKGT